MKICTSSSNFLSIKFISYRYKCKKCKHVDKPLYIYMCTISPALQKANEMCKRRLRLLCYIFSKCSLNTYWKYNKVVSVSFYTLFILSLKKLNSYVYAPTQKLFGVYVMNWEATEQICIKIKLGWTHIDGFVQERRNSIANAMELRLSCPNPSI